MDQRIINLFDEFTHRPLSRDKFMRRLVQLTGSTAAALAVLPLLEVNYAHAQTVPESDPRLKTERIEYPGEGMTMKGYLARPARKGKLSCVMVVHENRGLNPHIEDVTRRMALEGFVAMAPDALSGLGGTPADQDKARELFQKLDSAQTEKSFARGFDYFATRKDAKPSWGCVGFCWGGAMTNRMAVFVSKLKAAVPYYGRQPEAGDVPKINAALLLQYGGMDERINAGIPAYEEALKANGKEYKVYIYEGAQHAFNNDTAPTRYNADVAKLAWERTVAFLKEKLG